jgi:anaerobic selenocysteine-containing dehydrogenase
MQALVDPAAPPSERTVHATCPHDCPDTCSMQVHVREGRVVAIQGSQDHRITRGALCTKVSRYAERTYHPERLLQPRRRVGPKGSGRFETIGWDEALGTIAARLKAIAARDAQAIVPYSYAGTMGLLQGEAMASRLWNKLGASRLARTICAEAGAQGLTRTYGGKVGMHVLDFAASRLIVIWGSNSIASNLHFWSIAQDAKRAGAMLVCIDPRRTETADKCHHHIAPMPGTDGALALAIMREWFVRGLVDLEAASTRIRGLDGLRTRAMAWTLERAAQTCGVDAGRIAWLANEMAQVQPLGIRLNYGMQRVHGGGNATRLIALLPCLLDAWRHRGGGLLMSSSGWFSPVKRDAQLERQDLLAGRTPRTVNMSTIGDALLHQGSREFGPRIEALVVYNSNPVAVAPESPKVVQGFRREDLFTVVLEHFMTDTADHADIVLPATTQLEHLDVHTAYGHTDVMFNEPAIAPLGQARSNTRIFREIAQRMGLDDPCFHDDDEALARQAIDWDKLGASFEQLREHGWVSLPVPEQPFADGRFPTADGRADATDADHVPNHESVASSPELAQRYPLAMISPPARNFLNSTFVNVKSLRSIEGEPWLEIDPADAQARGIVQGAMVRVFNDRGEYRCRARVDTRARRGVVNGLGVWWRKLGPAGTNVNEVTSQALTDIGQAATFYDCLVEVQALDEASVAGSDSSASVAAAATVPARAARA